MARPRKQDDASLKPIILREAAIVLADNGYEGASLRLIASRVGISAPSIYHYYASKEALLFAVLEDTVLNFLMNAESTLARTRDDPIDQLSELVKSHVRFQVQNHYRARIYERTFSSAGSLRNLLSAEQARIIETYNDRYNVLFRDVLKRGVKLKSFDVKDIVVVSFAILSLCEDILRWFKPSGRLSLDQIAAVYAKIALRIVGCDSESV